MHHISSNSLDWTGSRNFGVWDAIALPYFRAKAQSDIDARAMPIAKERVRRKETDGHHTIPVYLCGALVQEFAEIDPTTHAEIHEGLSSVFVAKQASEMYADKVVFGGKRSPGIVGDLALTSPGRTAISNAISSFYYYGGYDSRGAPGFTIGEVFNRESPKYIAGNTSLPLCSRTFRPLPW